MRIVDRYVIREILPPFVIALLVFTFVLIIPAIIELAEELIAKGVPWPTILRMMGTLVPSTLALTIPMALLLGTLVAFGRLSADREVMVLMACGMSPFRLLRPVMMLAVVAALVTFWVMVKVTPDANQANREITLQVLADRAEGQVRAREFFEDFPNTVLYVQEIPQGGGWRRVLAADMKDPARPVLLVAESGRMLINRQAHTIEMVLERGARHTTNAEDPAIYESVQFEQLILTLDPESVFRTTLPRGEREMTIAELQALVEERRARNEPYHNTVMELHTKFSIPVACLVFAVLGVAFGVSHRKDGKLASFVLGVAVIFVYYVIMFTSEAMTKGALMPAWLSRWVPNLLLGAAGVAYLVARARGVDRSFRLRMPSLSSWRRPGRHTPTDEGRSVSSSRPTVGPVVVLRFPQLDLPRPNLLDRYVMRTYVRILALSIVAILGLFYISTFIDMSDKMFKGQVTPGTILSYLWWATPQFFYYVLAIGVLLSAIVTIGLLTKNSELVVMRACGISLYRTALPLFFLSVVASAVLFAFEERVLAVSNRRADYLKHIIRGGSPQTFDVLNRKWIVGRNGDVYHYQYFDPRRLELNGVSVFRFDPATHTITERVFATQARYNAQNGGDANAWTARAGWARTFAGPTVTRYQPFETERLLLEPGAYFVTEAPEPARMTFAQLRRYIDDLKASGYTVLDHEVALYRKVSFPLVTLVMTLIAVPFAVTTGKRGAMYGIGFGILLALVYWTAGSVFAAFGAGALLAPSLAAWAPNLLFGAVAAYLLLTVRT
jgi:LPS export ABC transporter permease LptG/LPS export ABC transporter permease LptF